MKKNQNLLIFIFLGIVISMFLTSCADLSKMLDQMNVQKPMANVA